MGMIAGAIAVAVGEVVLQTGAAAFESMNSRTQQVGEQAAQSFENANEAFSKDIGACISADFSGPNAENKEDLMKPILSSHPELWNRAP